MKIAQVCPYDIARPGGVQRHILDLSSSLAAMGHQVAVIAPRVSPARPAPPVRTTQGNVTIIEIGSARLVSVNETVLEVSFAFGDERKKLDHMMRSGSFDVVHFHTPLSPFLALQALWRSTAVKIGTFHAVPPETASASIQRFLYRTLNRRVIAKLDGVILASSVQEDLRLAGSILPPCTDLRRFGSGAAPLAAFRDDRVNILFVGRLEPRKGAAILLEAFAVLRQQNPRTRLLVAGEGPERQRLERDVAEAGIPDVVFLGRIDDADLPRLYATCDVFCAPSIYGEGFGIVLVEAMASGKPVVAAANAGYATLLHGEAARFLVGPGDVSDLRSKLGALAADSELRTRLGAWGQREARRYDSAQLAPAFVAVYEQAMVSRLSKAGALQ
ncbi:MAG: glycosyltransferase family 4 protein [Bradyrhizobium sp.]|uniref:glycosyltransferase family 4 protein n=1 Tax=Bradyrhizobium sp. TaxID=376 RepID=UPI002A26ACA8|nr:glycosyltransferase family 4 protein [Bradyrhizobium sp.]